MENRTPQELFNRYKELDGCVYSCPIDEYEMKCEEMEDIANILDEKGHIVAYHPKSGLFLFPKL